MEDDSNQYEMLLNLMFVASIVHTDQTSALGCWGPVIDRSINDLTWPASVIVMDFLRVEPVHPS
jgi:hypothetical protein